MRLPPRLLRVSLALVVALGVAAAARAGDGDAEGLTLAQRFEATARADGAVHGAGVEALAAEGERLVGLCEERAAASDVRERQLARYLLLAVHEPERVAEWRKPLADRYARVELAAADPRRIRVVPQGTKDAPVELGADAVPFLVTSIRSAPSPEAAPPAAVRALAELGDADAAPTLARLLDASVFALPGDDGAVVAGLRRLGAGALPTLRGLLEGDPACGSSPDWGRESSRVAAAAHLVADAGDVAAIPSLRTAFARVDAWHAGDVAQALATLDATDAAPQIAEWYVETIVRRVEEGERQRLDSLWRVEGALVRLGPAGVAALRDATETRPAFRALADGVAFRVEWPGGDEESIALLAERALVERSAGDAQALLRRAPDVGTPIAVALAEGGDRRDTNELLLALAEARRPELVGLAARIVEMEACRNAEPLVEALVTDGGEPALAIVRLLPDLAKRPMRDDSGAFRRALPLVEALAAVEFDAARALEECTGEARIAAARVLARRGDASGVEALVEDALERHDTRSPQGSVALLLRLGDAARPELERLAVGPDGPKARAAGGFALRLRDPELAERFDSALRDASRVERYHVVRERDRMRAAEGLVTLGPEVLLLCDLAHLVYRSRIAGYAARIWREELDVPDRGDPPPPPAGRTDVDAVLAEVAAGRLADNIASGELQRGLGLREATEQLVLRVRDAADDHARWRALRVLAQIVWVYPGREHDTQRVLVEPRKDAQAALLALVSSSDRVLAGYAFAKATSPMVDVPEDALQERLARWAAEDVDVPNSVLMWLGTHGDDGANAALLARYDAERMGKKELAKHFGRVRYARASASMWRAADLWILKRPGYWTRIAELDALGRIGGAENLDRLVELYRSDELLKVRLQAADCLATAGDARILNELAEEFAGLVRTELANAKDDPYASRKGDYIVIHRPALALLRMDPERGARVVYDALLTSPEGRVREALLTAVADYRREHPEFVPPATSGE